MINVSITKEQYEKLLARLTRLGSIKIKPTDDEFLDCSGGYNFRVFEIHRDTHKDRIRFTKMAIKHYEESIHIMEAVKFAEMDL